MQDCFQRWIWLAATAFVLAFSNAPARAADVLNWNTNKNLVSADIQSVPVSRLLGAIAGHTGWQVLLEPNVTHNVSTKFQDLNAGQALRMLLGDLNFAIVPETNGGPTHLYVFRTSMAKATKIIRPEDLVSKISRSGKIPNELVVTVKPGVNIDGLDCLKDASVTGKIDALNTYRVQFKDEDAAKAAQSCLSGNSDVLAVESNFSMEQPDAPRGVANASPQFNLTPKANDGSCQVVIGLIDTPVGALGNNLDQFMLKQISVAGDAPTDSQLTHGTAMADTILRGLQANTGGSTSVKILPVDVYGASETTIAAHHGMIDFGNKVFA